MKCSFGCGNDSIKQFKNGNFCCSTNLGKCPEIIKKNRESNLGKKHSDETKKKMSEQRQGNKFALGSKHSEETKNLFSIQRSGINNPIYGTHRSDETKQKIREKSLIHTKGEGNGMYGKHQSEEAKIKIGIKSKEKFKDPSVLEKFRFKGGNKTKNKMEEKISILLVNLNINSFEFVGNYSLFINGKSPDFIDKERKLIIEFFGDYWHGEQFRKDTYKDFKSNKEHEEDRVNHFKNEGYNCLIIWESEFKNIKQLEDKIVGFCSTKFY